MPDDPAFQALPPSTYTLRPLRFELDEEIDLVVARSMKTVLDTIPEFGGDEEIARKTVPNFSHSEMRAMYLRDRGRSSTHRFVLAHCAEGSIAGHAIYFLRDPGRPNCSGYLFTLYVDEQHRRCGLARSLLAEAVSWLHERGARSVMADTHVTNTPFLRLAQSLGFIIGEEKAEPWPHFAMTCAITQRSTRHPP